MSQRRINLLIEQAKPNERIHIEINNIYRLEHLIEIARDYNPQIPKVTSGDIEEFMEKYFDNPEPPYNLVMIKIPVAEGGTKLTYRFMQVSDISYETKVYTDKSALAIMKTLSEILNPAPIKEEKVKTTVKVFDKRQPNMEQALFQMFIFDIKEKRPFVLKLIEDEFKRIKTRIRNSLDFLQEPAQDCYNIKLISSYENLKEFKEDTTIEMDIATAIEFYIYQKEMKKELNPRTKKDYSWIQEYLTHDNLNNPEEVVLFESKKIKISINEGKIGITQYKNCMIQTVDIKYSTATNTFHL